MTMALWQMMQFRHMMYGWILLVPIKQRGINKPNKEPNISGQDGSRTHGVLQSYKRNIFQESQNLTSTLWFITTSNM